MTPSLPPSDKPSLTDQIADIVVKVVMTGGVAGGGLGAFWSLFKESDLPKAIASLAIGLGISYAAKLLSPLHQGNQKRLEKAGQAIDEKVEWVTDQLIAKATGFENKYLLCQAAACQRLRAEGMVQREGLFVPLLKDVFVPLQLDFSALQPGLRAPQPDERMLDEQMLAELSEQDSTIWTFLTKAKTEPVFRRLAILAWGGYGKTTLLKHIAFRYGTRQQPKNAPHLIPVLLVFRNYRHLLSQANPPSLPDLIHQHHIPGLPGAQDLPIPANWAKDALTQGRAIVMFDGFDEVPKAQRSGLATWLNTQMHHYGKSIFLITSRPKAYKEQDAAEAIEMAAMLWVKDFQERQRRDFVEKWYLCQERYASVTENTPDVRQVAQQAADELLQQIETRPELRDLAKNPLLLNMIVTFHRRYPDADLPKRKVELYREICDLQLKDRPRARKLETCLTTCNAQEMLQRIAFGMMQARQERIPETDLINGLNDCLQDHNEAITATELLRDIVEISELLVQQEDEYEFAHLSFQEYLAAAHIAQQKQEPLLYDHFENSWWKPTILLYAAQVNPTSLIREALSRGANDLAYRCVQDTTKRIDNDLKAIVLTAYYQKLEDYLKTGQWKEADQETYRLMITAVGKEVGQWFGSEELLNFPCEELLAIDGLWVKYSNGRFGFSVQKQIYVECGGTLDGKYPGDKIWEDFGDRVGWRMQNDWRRYYELNFSTNARHGHLPACMGIIGWYRGQVFAWAGGHGIGFLGFRTLFSRIQTCKV